MADDIGILSPLAYVPRLHVQTKVIATGPVGDPREPAYLAAFLASTRSSYHRDDDARGRRARAVGAVGRSLHGDARQRYAQNGDVNIAYQVIGKGPLDLILALGFATHVEVQWELPAYAHFIERLSSFARVIVFDKRGMGLSDRPAVLTTFEEQLDDLCAVLDAVGAKRPALFGWNEGGPMSLLFAATYPERTAALVLLSSYAKATRSEDYPFGPTPEVNQMIAARFASEWGRRVLFARTQAPSLAHDESFQYWLWRQQRYAMSPGAALAWLRMTTEIDIRHVLPVIRVPTLILHRAGDTVVDPGASRYMAERIATARYVELPGNDNFPLAGDVDAILDEVEEFLTGVRPAPVQDRVLATVMMTDIVGSTETAVQARRPGLARCFRSAPRRRTCRARPIRGP